MEGESEDQFLSVSPPEFILVKATKELTKRQVVASFISVRDLGPVQQLHQLNHDASMKKDKVKVVNMACSSLLACIQFSLLDIDLLLKHPSLHAVDDDLCNLLKFRLRNLKIFAVLSEGVLGEDASLASFLGRVEDTICRNAEKFHPLCLHLAGSDAGMAIDMAYEFCSQLQSLMEEPKEWLVALSDPARQQSTSLTTNELFKIISCMLQNIEDFIALLGNYDSENVSGFEISMKIVEEQMTLLNAHVCFAHQRSVVAMQDLLVHTEAIVFNAAFLLYLYEDFYGSTAQTKERLEVEISTIAEKMKNRQHQFYEIYSQALSSSKFPGRSLAITLQDIDDDDAFTAIKKALNCIIPSLWDILRMNSGRLVFMKDQPQQLFEALRSLRKTILKTQWRSNIKKDIGAAICDAGVLVSLLHKTNVDLGLLQDLLETIKSLLAEVGDEEPQLPQLNLPVTNQLGFFDFVLEKLMEITSHEGEPTANSEPVQIIQKELVSLRAFLGKIVKLRYQQVELQVLWDRVMEMACRVEELVDLLVVGDVPDSFWSSFDSIMKDLRNIKPEMEVKRQDIKVTEVTWSYRHVQAQTSSSIGTNEIVGFADEAKSIIDQLTRGTKLLRMMAIVGMPGLGKTTLAAKIYNDPSIVHHFQVRAWSTISQVINKEKVLCELLNQIGTSDVTSEMGEHDIIEKLWRSLKGKRYLIVLDDIWDIEAWNSLRESFPEDHNQSRILLTSRRGDVSPNEMLVDQKPHFLRQLNMEESLKLLHMKFPGVAGWHLALHEHGMQIAEICNGLPLTIIIIAGLLVTIMPEGWKEILNDLRLGHLSVTDHCLETLERSYEHLPEDLRPCLLYLGTFPEDEVVSARMLLHLWVAEGFIRKAEGKRAEDVAEDYLMDLIGRSLIMVDKKRWDNGVKTCRIHDLIYDFCLKKAKDEHFFHLLKGYDELSTFNEPCKLRRLSIHSKEEHFAQSKLFCPWARSLLYHSSDEPNPLHRVRSISFVIDIFKRLRVLDLGQIHLQTELPSEIELLVQLAFLAIHGDFEQIPPSIGKLSYLETFIVITFKKPLLPASLWNLRKLKNLYIGRLSDGGGILPIESLDSLPVLYELDRFSMVLIPHWGIMERLARKFPNIRRLGCTYMGHQNPENPGTFVVPEFLSQLESLSIGGFLPELTPEFSCPKSLKKLTLESCDLSSRSISMIGTLPNLQVLKLVSVDFEGNAWEMEEGEFSKLRILKLDSFNLVKWSASDDQFKCLETLKIRYCCSLEEIPSCLESIATLETIKVHHCSENVENMVRQIQEKQVEDCGNSDLKVIIK
ncbi:OLC1v1005848C1 [Oldenlandia corymbosa var. corymbosa]|uniref:OLC1v1005848C1 n=1 Tax=Oldenlandia corymbosa var. corymbosa TaxID=529605 RepID=A0AAV1DFP4_OLDCO|nr:OLC1v1005848C1 [Oldenlandia corymbosa var. corymbosa]